MAACCMFVQDKLVLAPSEQMQEQIKRCSTHSAMNISQFSAPGTAFLIWVADAFTRVFVPDVHTTHTAWW